MVVSAVRVALAAQAVSLASAYAACVAPRVGDEISCAGNCSAPFVHGEECFAPAMVGGASASGGGRTLFERRYSLLREIAAQIPSVDPTRLRFDPAVPESALVHVHVRHPGLRRRAPRAPRCWWRALWPTTGA